MKHICVPDKVGQISNTLACFKLKRKLSEFCKWIRGQENYIYLLNQQGCHRFANVYE